MKLYIAGKITGKPGYRREFGTWARKFRMDGYIVMNPANLPEGMEASDYMRICFAMVDSADAVFMIPGWQDSRGARTEWNYARYIGKQILTAAGLDQAGLEVE